MAIFEWKKVDCDSIVFFVIEKSVSPQLKVVPVYLRFDLEKSFLDKGRRCAMETSTI